MSERNPWKTLSSQIVYSNSWIQVREDQVVRPDGKPGVYGVVQTRIATGVVALTPEEEIYLVGQYRYPMECYSWEIVEGGSDPGEAPLSAAKRELLEEAGLKAETWEQLGPEFHLSNCHSNERAFIYLARNLSQFSPCPDGCEELQIRKLPLTEVFGMADSGEIKDALTLIALARLRGLGEHVQHLK